MLTYILDKLEGQVITADRLFIAKLYNVDSIENARKPEGSKFSKVSTSYALLIKSRFKNEYIIVPNSKFSFNQKVFDVKDINANYQLFIQPDSIKRCKPLTYYAPSAQGRGFKKEDLTKISEFVVNNIVENNHANRHKLDEFVQTGINATNSDLSAGL